MIRNGSFYRFENKFGSENLAGNCRINLGIGRARLGTSQTSTALEKKLKKALKMAKNGVYDCFKIKGRPAWAN
jgi:hypothetical protein